MAFNLKNSLLVEASLREGCADLKLPRELVHQMRAELKQPSICLRDIKLEPIKPGNQILGLKGELSCDIFIVLNMDKKFTPRDFVARLNDVYKKIFLDHELASLEGNAVALHLMEGQNVFAVESDVFAWLLPDNVRRIMLTAEVRNKKKIKKNK